MTQTPWSCEPVTQCEKARDSSKLLRLQWKPHTLCIFNITNNSLVVLMSWFCSDLVWKRWRVSEHNKNLIMWCQGSIHQVSTTGKKRNSQLTPTQEPKKFFDFKSEFLGGGPDKIVDGGGPGIVDRWVDPPPQRPPPPCSCASCCGNSEPWGGGWAPPPPPPPRHSGPSPMGAGPGPNSIPSQSPIPNGPQGMVGAPQEPLHTARIPPGPGGPRCGSEQYYCGPPIPPPAPYYRLFY